MNYRLLKLKCNAVDVINVLFSQMGCYNSNLAERQFCFGINTETKSGNKLSDNAKVAGNMKGAERAYLLPESSLDRARPGTFIPCLMFARATDAQFKGRGSVLYKFEKGYLQSY